MYTGSACCLLTQTRGQHIRGGRGRGRGRGGGERERERGGGGGYILSCLFVHIILYRMHMGSPCKYMYIASISVSERHPQFKNKHYTTLCCINGVHSFALSFYITLFNHYNCPSLGIEHCT